MSAGDENLMGIPEGMAVTQLEVPNPDPNPNSNPDPDPDRDRNPDPDLVADLDAGPDLNLI